MRGSRVAFQAAGFAPQMTATDIALDAWFIPEATSCRDQLQAFLRRKTIFDKFHQHTVRAQPAPLC